MTQINLNLHQREYLKELLSDYVVRLSGMLGEKSDHFALREATPIEELIDKAREKQDRVKKSRK